MAIECMKINPWIVLKPPQSQRRRFLINNVSEANWYGKAQNSGINATVIKNWPIAM